ncbi:MAG: FAD binding domain-containing protein [Bacteroidia bacterium]|nr:FAD binding domain-containing protein [Bacteroidia bacterium]
MNKTLEEKKFLKAYSVDEAIKSASECGKDYRFLAGGTDLIVNKFQGNETVKTLIDITPISELNEVKIIDQYLSIGSLVKLDTLNKFPSIVSEFPALIEAAKAVASPVIRKSATIGGNILVENRCSFFNQSEWWREAVGYCLKCNGDICIATGGKNKCFSKFVSDTVPVLICLGAKISVINSAGSNTIKLEDVYTGDGVHSKNIKHSDLVRSVLIPLGNESRIVFKKLRQRKSLEFTSLTSAVSLNKRGEIVVALSGVDPKPVVVYGTSDDSIDDLINTAVKKARIVDNDVFSREYRKEMISIFLKQSFLELGL